jgi:uncharacterized protein (TIGR02598 family)
VSNLGVRNEARAFSLVEIVLALAIISFAIVGIMGLFPVAMKSAQESQMETRAALIARQIFSDLKTFPGTNVLLATSEHVLDPGVRLSLTSNSVFNVSYDGEGRVVTGSQPAMFEAVVSVLANDPVPGVSRVQASVRPTSVSSNFAPYQFVSLMNQ